MSGELRVCKKCLPGQELDETYFQNLTRYIERMDEFVKVDQETYERRLEFCGSCEKQMKGMCRLCGCFVELRAAQKIQKCPDIPAKWERSAKEE